MPTQTTENYLKASYFLHQKDENISLTELSELMDVSKPTANNMVKKMQDKGWVNYEKYKPLQLTDKGYTSAALIVRKHRLAEMFLHKIMGFGWEEVHDIAEELEHLQSDTFFDRIAEMLEHPNFDPHGSPIPDVSGKTNDYNFKKLSSVAEGKKVILKAVADSSKELLIYLNKKDIELGMEITVLQIESFDKSMLVQYENHNSEMLSFDVTKSLLVESK